MKKYLSQCDTTLQQVHWVKADGMTRLLDFQIPALGPDFIIEIFISGVSILVISGNLYCAARLTVMVGNNPANTAGD